MPTTTSTIIESYLLEVCDQTLAGPALRALATVIAPHLMSAFTEPPRTTRYLTASQGQMLAHVAFARELMPEEVYELFRDSGAAVLVSALPPCDVCGNPARYDGTAYQRLGYPRGYLCRPCWSYRGAQPLGFGWSTHLAVEDDLSVASKSLVDAVTTELDRESLWERPTLPLAFPLDFRTGPARRVRRTDEAC